MKKMWGGRFNKHLDQVACEYSYSLSVDKELLPYDIQATIAHVKTLKKAKVLKPLEATKLIKGLMGVEGYLKSKDLLKFNKKFEDVHTLINDILEQKVGVVARKVHTARSRNDQVITATKLYMKEKITIIINKLTQYQKALLVLAKTGKSVAIPGYTHLQRAQVVLFAHHILAYLEMAERDKERFKSLFSRVDRLPLGSGSLAGLSFSIDRAYTAKLLGFSKICENSIDAVSSRDDTIEFLSCISILFMHLSRLSEDFILWNSQEFGFIDIPDDFTTGSSIMPHKKNADMFELTRGRAGKAFGNLVSVLVTMKGLPLAYNRDMQEDKEPLFSSVNLAINVLSLFSKMIPKIKIKKDSCFIASSDSFLYATDLMDHLVKGGIALRDAHFIVGQIVSYSLKSRKDLSELSLKELKKFSHGFDIDPKQIFNSKQSLSKRKSFGSTNPSMVKRMISSWERRLDKK